MTTTNPHLTSITSFEIFNFAVVFGGTQAEWNKKQSADAFCAGPQVKYADHTDSRRFDYDKSFDDNGTCESVEWRNDVGFQNKGNFGDWSYLLLEITLMEDVSGETKQSSPDTFFLCVLYVYFYASCAFSETESSRFTRVVWWFLTLARVIVLQVFGMAKNTRHIFWNIRHLF